MYAHKENVYVFTLLRSIAISDQLTGYLFGTVVAGYKISKRLVAYTIQTVYFNAIALEFCEILIADDM